MLKVLALREKFAHMSKVSGYDALYSHFPADVLTDSVFCNFKKIYPRGIGRLLSTTAKIVSPSGFYNAQSVEAEAALIIKSRKQKFNLIHYSFGEPYWGMGAIFKKSFNAPVVITNHQPQLWWYNNSSLFKKYERADKVITLSEHDRDYFNQYITDKAVYIPHGVDTNFFKPAASKPRSSTFRIIFAGRYLRDMPTLSATIKNLSLALTDITFDLIIAPDEPDLNDLTLLPNVKFHVNVEPEQLLLLYQQAHCCLIPLMDCTANNVILEAMACGLTLVTTDLPAVKSYLDDSCALFGTKQSVNDLCEAVKLLYKNTAQTEKMGAAARRKALKEFSWPVVASATADLYRSII